MRIRFYDTGETFHITGERRQFWLFDKNGEPGRAVKGSDAYEILDGDGTLPETAAIRYGISVRDEVTDFQEIDLEEPQEELFDDDLPEPDVETEIPDEEI